MKKGFMSAALVAVAVAVSGCASVGQQGMNYQPRPDAVAQGDSQLQHRLLELILHGDYRYADAHINVDAYNGHVLLTGQVQNQELKTMAGDAVKRQNGVKDVRNELEIGENTSRAQRVKDSWITTNINSRLVVDNSIDSESVHVITENGVVYLMGTVSKHAADDVASLAASIDGVRQVVKVFQYIGQ
ncbi:BON domain-containing protein [Larsenimonas salina]|uniref:BON domain-containing protein n=1 Tax=Larsenimonas salina TaxID=1295565 RepID=UPI002073E0F5|nr:BON domain-containing protein [Larsenimonas salina]MCM5703132.1 BON domain-containing protein [Larsenimonas salina]